MGTSEIISLILSLATITVAVLALFISIKQIKMSNKQSLFKERVQSFIKLNGMVELYGNERKHLDKAEEMPDFLFVLLTKNLILIEENFFVGKPLSKEEGDKFLREMENLRSVALEITLLWNTEDSKIASKFVYAYSELVMNLFKQHTVKQTLINRRGYSEEALKCLTQDIKLSESISLIETIYLKLKSDKILDLMSEQIKLK